MLISYLRSSSYGRWNFCQHLYGIEYVLGHKGKESRAGTLGNMCHKLFECLSLRKKYGKGFDEPYLGRIELTDSVDDILRKSFDYHVSKSIHTWAEKDYKESKRLVDIGLNFRNGMFDPRNLNIVDVEKDFDIEIKKPWAKLDKPLDGYFGIKGNVDFIFSEEEDGRFLSCLDWKSGSNIDWNSNEKDNVKTFDKLMKDPQLLIYYYALRHMYPKAEQITMIMFYLKHGVQILPYGDDEFRLAEKIIKERFEEIKKTEVPRLLSNGRTHFKCKSFCSFSKDVFQHKDNKKCLCTCAFIQEKIKEVGMDEVMKKYSASGYDITAYGDGGGKTK